MTRILPGLLLALLLGFVPAVAEDANPDPAPTPIEDTRLLNVDPTYLAPYVSLGYEHEWRQGGGQLSKPTFEALYPFGAEDTQAVTLRLNYNFLDGVESFEDVELAYTWLFDHQDSLWQSAVIHVYLPTAGDPLVGGDWSLEGEYNMRWQLEDNLIWVNELHYYRNVSAASDYLETASELTRLLSEDYLVSVGAKLRYELTAGATALAARLGLGRSLSEDTNLNLTLEQALNTQGRASFSDFKVELSLTRQL